MSVILHRASVLMVSIVTVCCVELEERDNYRSGLWGWTNPGSVHGRRSVGLGVIQGQRGKEMV